MKLYRSQIGGIVLALALIFSVLIWSKLDRNRLLKDHTISVAKITDCSYGGRGHAGTITFYYNFYFNERKIEGGCAFNTRELNFDDAKSFLLGRSFPVIFNAHNSSNNFLLIRPDDFKKFGYSFPDSLKWVLHYLHAK